VAQVNPANQATIVTPTEVSHSLTVHLGLRRTADFPGNEIAMRSKLGSKAVVPAGKSARAPHMQPPTAQGGARADPIAKVPVKAGETYPLGQTQEAETQCAEVYTVRPPCALAPRATCTAAAVGSRSISSGGSFVNFVHEGTDGRASTY
jgi:hypothetical protein